MNPVVERYLDAFLPDTMVCAGIKYPDTSTHPRVPIERLWSFGYAPPPTDNPTLFGVMIFINVLEDVSVVTIVSAYPVFAVLFL